MDRSNVLGVAGIHATIIAIFVGVLSAYGLYVTASIGAIEQQAFEIAERVNDLEPFGYYGIGGKGFDPESVYMAGNADNREKLFRRIEDFASDYSKPSYQPDKKMHAERVSEVLRIISAVLSSYPFRTRFFWKEGRPAVPKTPARLEFDNTAELEQWVDDMELVDERISWYWSTQRKVFDKAVRRFSLETLTAQIQASPNGPPAESVKLKQSYEAAEAVYVRMLEAFGRNINSGAKLARQVKDKLSLAQSTRARYPSITSLLILLTLTAVAFLSGVMIPLLGLSPGVDVPNLFLTWIPFAIYSIIFIWIVLSMTVA